MNYKKITKSPFQIKGAGLKKKANEILTSPLKCTVLKRNINTSKFITASQNKPFRKRYIECGFELIKKTRKKDNCFQKTIIKKQVCYEFLGRTKENEKFKVHLREEIINNNKILFLISVFPIKQKRGSNPS